VEEKNTGADVPVKEKLLGTNAGIGGERKGSKSSLARSGVCGPKKIFTKAMGGKPLDYCSRKAEGGNHR